MVVNVKTLERRDVFVAARRVLKAELRECLLIFARIIFKFYDFGGLGALDHGLGAVGQF